MMCGGVWREDAVDAVLVDITEISLGFQTVEVATQEDMQLQAGVKWLQVVSDRRRTK